MPRPGLAIVTRRCALRALLAPFIRALPALSHCRLARQLLLPVRLLSRRVFLTPFLLVLWFCAPLALSPPPSVGAAGAAELLRPGSVPLSSGATGAAAALSPSPAVSASAFGSPLVALVPAPVRSSRATGTVGFMRAAGAMSSSRIQHAVKLVAPARSLASARSSHAVDAAGVISTSLGQLVFEEPSRKSRTHRGGCAYA